MTEFRTIRESREPSRRLLILTIGVTVLFFVLLSRLWYLQIVKAEDYYSLSENNRLRLVPVAASRGTLLDRNGAVLADNRASFSVAVMPQEVTDKDQLIVTLSRLLTLDPKDLRERWDKARRRSRYQPIILASGLTRDQVEILEENHMFLPGVDVAMQPIRDYPHEQLGAHLFGHLGEMSEQELGSERFKGYNPGDYVGKSGLERSWEKELHGVNGGRQIEVDAMGRLLRTINERNPVPGNSLVLTIDLAIQKQAEVAFGDKAGAAVALDVRTGEVLAFVSNPGFDPALFAGRLSQEQWNKYLKDPRHPLENKALKGQYPPGSTFKIITALAGLEEGMITEKTTVHCSGSHKHGSRAFRCWKRSGHGTVDLRKALRESCDVYFYRLGEQLGVDRIALYAKKFALGQSLGIGLDHEKAGLVPTTAWKMKRFGQKWLTGETLPVSIGQGYLLTTPIQLAAMTAAVANNGTVYRPHLVKKVVNPEGAVLRQFAPEIVARAGLRPESYRLVTKGLFAVVNEAGGTGSAARLYEVKVAGKTGTSQVVKLRDGRGFIPYQFRDHALFVAFAPVDNPEIAVAVVVEHGGNGSTAAAPVAGKILRAYFEGKGVIRRPELQKQLSSAVRERSDASGVAESPDQERREPHD